MLVEAADMAVDVRLRKDGRVVVVKMCEVSSRSHELVKSA
jgi:hypothetical protein